MSTAAARPRSATTPPRLRSWSRALAEHSSVLLFLAAWELLPRAGGLFTTFIAPPSAVVRLLWQLAWSGELGVHVGVSFVRGVTGFAVAAGVALPLGFSLAGRFPTLERVLMPVLGVFAQANPFSLFPFFILLFGIGELSKSAMVFWVCLWPLLFHTIAGVKGIEPLLVRAARSMGCGALRLFFKVILPAASPGIFTGLRSAASTAFFMLVAAEMIGASAGLGFLVWNAQINFQIPVLFTATVLITVLGLGLNALLGALERRLVAWNNAWSAP